MPAKWKRRMDLSIMVGYCVCMLATAVVLATEDLWWMALGQLFAMGMLVKYYRKARKGPSPKLLSRIE